MSWLEGSPSERGNYWVYFRSLTEGWRVALVEISPAVLNPGGRLLLKFSDGSAFLYEPNRESISHYMPVHTPAPPTVNGTDECRREPRTSRARRVRAAGDAMAEALSDWSCSGFFDPPTRAALRELCKEWEEASERRRPSARG